MAEMETIGRYQVKGEVGRGGMAVVFRAYDPRFERDVAIKVLPHEFLHDPQFRTRFEREAKTIALLEHPAIVPVYDFGEEQGSPYIVMRYMSGGSLSDRIRRGPATVKEVQDFFDRLAPALDAAHARGIIHRDIKPGNILYDQYGNSFLSDFGIARMAQSASAATLTGGNILGTPAYMSPEQVQGDKELDGRSDIYAMGVILYQLLTGSAPYQATTPARVMMMHILEPVPQLIKNRPDLPAQVQDVLYKAMAKEPEDRFSTCSEMSTALADAFKGIGAPTETHQAPPADATIVAKPVTPISGAKASSGPVTPARAEERTTLSPKTNPNLEPAASYKAAAVPAAAAIPAKKGGLPIWLIAGAVILALVIIGSVLAVGGTLLARSNAPTSTSIAAISPTVSAAETGAPTEGVAVAAPTTAPSPTPEPATAEPSPTPEPSATSEPTVTETPTNTPEPTATSTPSAVVLGGADKIAFLSNNDIWTANLDGSELIQLTTDGAVKRDMQWMPDGNHLVFINGKCIKTVEFPNGRQDLITCFNSAFVLNDFRISPDGTQVAISIDNEFLFVVPFEIEKLKTITQRKEIGPLGTCAQLSPYNAKLLIKSVRWSFDSKSLAFVFAAPINGRREDTIRVIDISKCYDIFPRIGVEFPNIWFTIKGWDRNPAIPGFGWNGKELFVLNGMVRNGGFGDLYIFNNDLTRSQNEVNPIDKSCCYRDAQFSPDGQYLVFAYQAISADNKIQLFMIPVGTLDTGEKYKPIPLPDTLFTERDASPQPVLRPAKP